MGTPKIECNHISIVFGNSENHQAHNFLGSFLIYCASLVVFSHSFSLFSETFELSPKNLCFAAIGNSLQKSCDIAIPIRKIVSTQNANSKKKKNRRHDEWNAIKAKTMGIYLLEVNHRTGWMSIVFFCSARQNANVECSVPIVGFNLHKIAGEKCLSLSFH